MSENEEKNEEFELRQFMRNKYFYGKLMTVTDFELEQEYFNRKRYLLNRLIYGKGLLCGFRHFKVLTENSNGEVNIIFKDGGVALNSLGQEIVVPKNVKKKILVKSDKSFNKNDFRDKTYYLYLMYSPRYSSLASERGILTSNSLPNGCPRILEDFEVIASDNYPEEEKNEMRSCTEDAKADTKVFFVAVKKNSNGELSIDEVETSLWQHYLKDHLASATRNLSATGVVHFRDFNTNTITSNLIDPKLGKGPIFVQLGQETEDGKKVTTGDDGDLYEKGFSKLHLGAIIEPHSGKFRVKVVFDDEENDRKSIRVRWWAFAADKIYNKVEDIDGEAETEIIFKKFNFVSDPEVEAKIVENGLCESGIKNCMTDGIILGGDHYARIEKGLTLIKKDKGLIKAYVAMNGNQTKLAKLIIEQEKDEERLLMEDEEWYVGGGWVLEVEDIYKELMPPTARIKISFKEKEPKYFKVSKGSLVTYCDDVEGEIGVPLFVTYIHDIKILDSDKDLNNLILPKEPYIVLKYTWAISNIVATD